MLSRHIAAGCFALVQLNGCALLTERSHQAISTPLAAHIPEEQQPERRNLIKPTFYPIYRGATTGPYAELQKAENDRMRWLKANDVIKTHGLISMNSNIKDQIQTASVVIGSKQSYINLPRRVCQGC